jgi:hypothetical protein
MDISSENNNMILRPHIAQGAEDGPDRQRRLLPGNVAPDGVRWHAHGTETRETRAADPVENQIELQMVDRGQQLLRIGGELLKDAHSAAGGQDRHQVGR